MDGKALSGSAHRQQRHRHLLSAVTHAPTVTLAQQEVGAKTNETAAFRPLLQPLDLTGTVVTFDALHTVKDQVRWLVQEKKAHYIAVIKGNQPTASAQLKALPWEQVPVAHTVSQTGHGRRESRSVKTMAIAANLGGIAFPEARLALRIHRRRQESGKRQTRETVYAVTSLDTHQASPADLGGYVRGHWGIENSSHHVRDVVFAEDASTVHTDNAPRAMAALRNLAIGRLRLLEPTTSPRPPERSGTHPNTPSGSGASPTARSYRELEVALRTYRFMTAISPQHATPCQRRARPAWASHQQRHRPSGQPSLTRSH
ncbi:ISAs1 family transposase [Streptomyces sp. ALI-76-A]|uniref:ISAs1 family transposase n=1 Tax=Streptomyces sp. ALI-76-A TaxID=3025736 RepID=UPI00256F48DC|nr:ISAs1 family transposase [Streptomyces sp. ALI-76-A]MDL5198633.1 ISAs1 family transposase [Streptomyces sp. ALI-76-A]